jgi:hypothetical protein
MEGHVSGNEKSSFGEALGVGRKLNLDLPDSRAVQDAYARAHAESTLWLFNHVARSWLYGAKLAQRRALTPEIVCSGHAPGPQFVRLELSNNSAYLFPVMGPFVGLRQRQF